MIVYHGSTDVVRYPDVDHSYRSLDFGKGFYVTSVRKQAERWARRKAGILGKNKAIINIYQMHDNLEYDLISGKVANDKVFRVVDMYHTGIWDKERALKEIKVYPAYDQIAFITQKALNQLLTFESYEEV